VNMSIILCKSSLGFSPSGALKGAFQFLRYVRIRPWHLFQVNLEKV
jgi:hypothetical protein